MPVLSESDYTYLEKKLFLPMVIKILEKDLALFNKLPFKLNRPYIKIVEDTLSSIRKELKHVDIYCVHKNLKVVESYTTKEKLEYAFFSVGTEEHKKYKSEEIRNKCEKLMLEYLTGPQEENR